jgi:DNA polymerase I-like protein with 3'-5' exonuclease and polymerase domains
MIVFDIETDGLFDDATKVHCLVAKDVITKEVARFSDIHEGLEYLKQAESKGITLSGHNIVGFDLPVLKKLYDFDYNGDVFDTLVASRTIWSNLKELDIKNRTVEDRLIGSHSLKAWGQRLKFSKGTYGETENAWEELTDEMLDYCQQDVELNVKLLARIQAKNFSHDALQLEHTIHKLMIAQEQTGFPFDVQKAQELYSTLVARKDEIRNKLVDEVEPTVVEMKTKTKVIPFNPASRQQIGDRLQKLGWKPTEFTNSGDPKIDEKILANIDLPIAKLLTEYLMLNKRVGQLGEGKQGWLKLEKEGRIHGRVNHMGAVTSRCTHNNPNVAQVPSLSAEYGKECRELFRAPEGFKVLGADASGLELRCLAHYMSRYDDGEYEKEILEGDIHTKNQLAAGLETRPQAKTFIYGFLYGAGNEKIGQIIGKGQREGGQIKKRFLDKTPALKYLQNAVKQKASTGYVLGLDKRAIPIRHPHAALNTLLQSCGAIICKRWYATIEQMIRDKGISKDDAYIVAFVHDEVQIIIRDGLQETIGEITREAITRTEQYYDFKCKLDSEYKVGASWADTH